MAEAKNEPEYLSMPDPCPHYTRIDVIAAKIHNDADALNDILSHLCGCEV